MVACIILVYLASQFVILTSQRTDQKDHSVYVSQSRGKDSFSCGLKSSPCKTIVMGVWRVQHEGRVYVDGTGSETLPYTCKSSALKFEGIHSNKSMMIIGVQSIPRVKCQEGFDIRLNRSLLADHNGTTVNLTNLEFVSTSVFAQDVSLYIDNCIFTGSSQGVYLVQSTRNVSLSFNNSLCVNVSSCLAVNINQRVTPPSQVSIIVTNSNVTTSWYNPSSPEYSSGIHVTSTGEYEPRSITCGIALKNVRFTHHVIGFKGIIFLDLENALTSLYMEKVVFYESRATHQYIHIINIFNSYSLVVVFSNTSFLQNFQGSCGAIQAATKNTTNLHIVRSHFDKFQTERNRLVYLHSNHYSDVRVENTTFSSNTAIENESSCLSLNGGENAKLTIKDCTFINNTADSCAGVVWFYAKTSTLAMIQGCHFEANTVKNAASLGAFQGQNVHVEMRDSRVIATASYGGGVVYIGSGCVDSEQSVHNASLLFRNVTITRSMLMFQDRYEYSGSIAGISAYWASITMKDSVVQDGRAVAFVKESRLTAFYLFSSGSPIKETVNPKIPFNIKILNSIIEQKSAKFLSSYVFVSSESAKASIIIEDSVIDSLGFGITLNESSKLTINNSSIKNCFNSGFGRAATLLSKFSSLVITNSLFESNTTDGGCLCLPYGVYEALLRNVTFKNCSVVNTDGYAGFNGGAILALGGSKILIESCQFIENKATRGSGGAIAFSMQRNDDRILKPGCKGDVDPDSHRVWSYTTSVIIQNTLFINNTAVSGGALYFSRGNYTLQNCSFVDNFAKVQGGHIFITAASTSLTILDSSFLQQHSSKKISDKVTFYMGSFIDSQSEGPLRVLNSKLESTAVFQGTSTTLVTVTKAIFFDFGENNHTVFTCPRGNPLDILLYTTQFETEYKSLTCMLSLNVITFICKPCGTSTYSLQHGQSLGTNLVSGFKCLPCPFGAECFDTIRAETNFWGYKVQQNPPALNFTLCPIGYCKKPDKHDFLDYNSCHGNRAGPLCGECKDGYTETLLSPSCCHQDECQDTWLWGVAVVMVILMALYLIHKPRLWRMLKSHVLWFRETTGQEDEEDPPKERHSGGYLKIVFYFYQVVNVLLIDTSYNTIVDSHLLQPVVGLFNFEIRLSSRGLLCPLVGLTVVTKQLLFACPVFGLHLMIIVCYGCHWLLRKCKSKPAPALGPYIGAALETLLLGYAVLANTALKLLRCTSLGEETRLFIAGNVVCYQWWQYLLMVFVVVVIFPFIVTLALGSRWLRKGSISTKEFLVSCVIPLPYLMYKLIEFLMCGPQEPTPEPPEWRASVTAVLYGPFRHQQDNTTGAIYWESILISRRLVLILIYVFVADPLSKELLLTFSCVIILLHHNTVRPFRSQSVNIAEMVSLLGLVAIAMINAFQASFLSFGQVPRGPLESFSTVFNWIQVIILSMLPVLIGLAVVAAIISQLIGLVVKVWSLATCYFIQSRGSHVNDDVQSLLDPSGFDNPAPKT